MGKAGPGGPLLPRGPSAASPVPVPAPQGLLGSSFNLKDAVKGNRMGPSFPADRGQISQEAQVNPKPAKSPLQRRKQVRERWPQKQTACLLHAHRVQARTAGRSPIHSVPPKHILVKSREHRTGRKYRFTIWGQEWGEHYAGYSEDAPWAELGHREVSPTSCAQRLLP